MDVEALKKKIRHLLIEKDGLLLAHNDQRPEIQDGKVSKGNILKNVMIIR